MWLLVLHTGNQGGEFFKAWLARSRPQTQASSNSTNLGSWTWVLELISLMYWQLDSRSNLWNPGKHLQPFEPSENNDEQIDNLHLFIMNRLKKSTSENSISIYNFYIIHLNTCAALPEALSASLSSTTLSTISGGTWHWGDQTQWWQIFCNLLQLKIHFKSLLLSADIITVQNFHCKG